MMAASLTDAFITGIVAIVENMSKSLDWVALGQDS